MATQAIQKIAIVGGGTAGWMTAAALMKFVGTASDKKARCEIVLVESDEIGTVGVGEGTLPLIRQFNQTLGIDEAEFIRETNATYKLGIEFCNWARIGDAYLHPFGDYGFPVDGIEFYHFWLALKEKGLAGSLDDYSLPAQMAYANKFTYPERDPSSLLSTFSYAFHLDATAYARYLRRRTEAQGIKRIEGRVEHIIQTEDGSIESLKLASGEDISADLYIDCTGFRALLIGDTFKSEFCDWSEWLSCDRAVAVPSSRTGELLSYTKAIAQPAGWQWRIPLQHRTGNGYVYSSKHISDDEAFGTLKRNLDGELLAEPNFLRFKAGHRKISWIKNCVAIGLSSGFLEPLESTSIQLIQQGITKLLELFPSKNIESCLSDEFNRAMLLEYESVRDFIVLNYHATERDDSPFWDYCRQMGIPQELKEKIDLYKRRGYIIEQQQALFLIPSWLAIYTGQHLVPEKVDPRVAGFDLPKLAERAAELKQQIIDALDKMASNNEELLRNCAPNHNDASPQAYRNLYGQSRI
jgi:Tryptophan halogenase.